MSDEISRATLCVWGGEDGGWEGGATQPPVVFSVAYGYPDVASWLDVALGRAPGHIYSRNTNPTVQAFEEKVRTLEGAAAATSFATGMAAISNTLFTLLAPGDRVVSVKDTYGGTNKIFTEFLPRWGVQVTLCDTADHAQIEAAIAEGCRVVYLESPTNPTLKVLDLARLAAAGHRAGAVVVTDNTFATPINQNPLQLGSDLVFIIMQIESTSSSNWSPLAVRRRCRHHRKRAHFVLGGPVLPIVRSCDQRASEVLGSQPGH